MKVSSKLVGDHIEIEFEYVDKHHNINGLINICVQDSWKIISHASLDSLTKMYIDTSRMSVDNVELYANYVRWQTCSIVGENDGTLIVCAHWFENHNDEIKIIIEHDQVRKLVGLCFELVKKYVQYQHDQLAL